MTRAPPPNKEVLIVPFVTNGSRRGSRLLAAALGLALAALAPATAQAKNDKHDAANPDACVADHVADQPVRRLGRPGRLRARPRRGLRVRRRGLDAHRRRRRHGRQPAVRHRRARRVLPRPAAGRERPQRLDVRRRDLHVVPPLRPQPRVVEGGASGSRCSTTTARASSRASSGPRRRLRRRVGAHRVRWPSNVPFDATGAAPVAFRFTPQGKGGDWRIDDVYVDPYARR